MAAKRYKVNPKTFTYEVSALPFRIRFYRFLRKILIAFILASLVNLLFAFFFYTPKMYRLTQHRNDLMMKYSLLNEKIGSAAARLEEIRERDNSVYRTLFAADTVHIDGVYTPYPEEKYATFKNDRFAPLITSTWMNLVALTRQLYARSVSLDELTLMAGDKEKMAESIPAIWPLDKRLIRNIGSFGGRADPISGYRARHEGMDFSGEIGTPIYATGNGRVMADPGPNTGYGKQVLLDHGFGYRTRYAHMSRITVMPGQHVKRGEKIGEMGNTGKSTGPHLHYEVHYLGIPVDPVNYFSREMSDEDFAKIIASAKEITYETE